MCAKFHALIDIRTMFEPLPGLKNNNNDFKQTQNSSYMLSI